MTVGASKSTQKGEDYGYLNHSHEPRDAPCWFDCTCGKAQENQ